MGDPTGWDNSLGKGLGAPLVNKQPRTPTTDLNALKCNHGPAIPYCSVEDCIRILSEGIFALIPRSAVHLILILDCSQATP